VRLKLPISRAQPNADLPALCEKRNEGEKEEEINRRREEEERSGRTEKERGGRERKEN
jgi:hypothetical protein